MTAPRRSESGEAIGKITAAAGYRGPLNVDFLYRESDGALFPLEINPRRGLGGILADMCICQFGQGYEKAVSAVAVHSLPVSNAITTYARLRDFLLRKGFFGRESKGMVILPYSVSTLARAAQAVARSVGDARHPDFPISAGVPPVLGSGKQVMKGGT